MTAALFFGWAIVMTWKWWLSSDRVILLETHIREEAEERMLRGDKCPYCSDRYR